MLLVSHDRQFVDNCVTDCWIFEGDGVIGHYAGGYADAHQQQSASQALRQPVAVVSAPPVKEEAKVERRRSNTKLSYNQLRELEQLPQRIETLEEQVSELQQRVADPAFFTLPHGETQPVLQALADSEQALEEAYARWESLETQKNAS